MDIVLSYYRDPELGDAFRENFLNQPNVQLTDKDITTLACDAVVSPANSFGFMDGGLDHALSERFGWDLQTAVQEKISALPEGELLIGKAIVLPTQDDKMPWLISAPTMRVPMSFNIATSINAYYAMKAILVTAAAHEEIKSVAIPGLCTGVGRMPKPIAAKQMFAAFDEIMLGNRLKFVDFAAAQKHQIMLNPDGLIWDF